MKNKLILLAVTLSACLRASAAVPPPDKLLPNDTLAVMTVPDVNKAMEIYSNAPQTRLWNDPSMQAFRTKFMDKLKSTLITPMEHDLGIHFDDYTGLPQGQLTFAIVQDGWQGSPGDTKTPAMVLLVDTKDKSAQLKSNLADLRKKWVDAGKTVKTEKIRDVEFSAITLSANDLPKSLRGDASDSADAGAKSGDAAGSKDKLYIGQADSLLIMASSPRVIEKILSAMSGNSAASLSELPAFAANRDAMFRDANTFNYGWVNLHLLVEALKRSVPPDPPSDSAGPAPSKIIAAVGLEGLKTAAFSTAFSPDGGKANLLLGVPEDARSGIFQLLAGESKDSLPPAFVPADAVKFQRYRLDGQKLWDGLLKMVGAVSQQGLGGLTFAISSAEASAKEKNPDFDIKKDLFGNLGDDLISYQKSPKGTSLAELGSPPSIFLIGSPKPDQLLGAINLLVGLAGSQGATKQREFLGHKIYSIQLPAGLLPTAGAAGPQASSLNYSAGNGYLAISTDSGMVEEFLRTGQEQGKSLRDAPGFNAAAQKVTGPGTSIFGYSNDGEQMRTFFKLLKSEDGSSQLLSSFDTLKMMLGQGPNTSLKDWVDFSLLPDYDKISKYFSFSVYAGGATPEGLVLKSYSPTPAH